MGNEALEVCQILRALLHVLVIVALSVWKAIICKATNG